MYNMSKMDAESIGIERAKKKIFFAENANNQNNSFSIIFQKINNSN